MLSQKYSTPSAVQKYLRATNYNREESGETVRSALSAFHKGEAHCLEAALLAAAILENHGYPPLVMSLESKDNLDHVIFVFKEKSGWGSIARSRENGLHGRAPVFKNLKSLALSYFDPFIDKTGRLTAFGVTHLDESKTRWRDSRRNLWKLENYLIELQHEKLKTSNSRYEKIFREYLKTGLTVQRGQSWW